MKDLREVLLTGSSDPVLDFKFIAADLGISKATFHRSVRPKLPVVQLSPRRLGCRKSDYEAWKAHLAPAAA